MKPQEFLRENEFIGNDAHQMHKSHQLHMLREECYHSAANAIKLHKLLGELPEGHDLDAWAAEKISLAKDYLKTVTEWLEYYVMGGTNEAMMAGGMEAFSMESAERQYAELWGEEQGVAEAQGRDEVGGAGVAYQAGYQDGKRAKSTGVNPKVNATVWGEHIADYRRGMHDAFNLPAKGVAEGEITRTATGTKHRSTAAYGGTEKDTDHLRTLDKATTNKIDKAIGVKFKKQGRGLDLGETTAAGSVSTVPAVGGGTLFGGNYSNSSSPFKKKSVKKESIIKR
jgi:hypothetical protein